MVRGAFDADAVARSGACGFPRGAAMTAPWLLPLHALLLLGVVLWLVSLRMHNVGIVDIFWGPMFAIIAGMGYVLGAGQPSRKLLALVLTLAWSGRLALHLALRNLGHAEDP